MTTQAPHPLVPREVNLRDFAFMPGDLLLPLERMETLPLLEQLLYLPGDVFFDPKRRFWYSPHRLTLGARWERSRIAVLERDRRTCVYCGATRALLHCDHVMPEKAGGPSVEMNLACSCGPCNVSKSDSDVRTWIATRPFAAETLAHLRDSLWRSVQFLGLS